jgi:ligand-binding sensor domain-containing protein/signal transduction histidine kinase
MRSAVGGPLVLAMLAACIGRGERLPLRTYTSADGLAHNSVHRIVRDSRGFLWFCTSEGLSQFDGYEFKKYGTAQGLPHRDAHDLIESRSGAYWAATGAGVCRFEPASARKPGQPVFTVFRVEGNERASWVNVLLEDDAGSIWCGTDAGLYRLEPLLGPAAASEWKLHRVDLGMPAGAWDDTIITSLAKHGSTLWVGSGSGLYRYNSGRTEQYTTRHGLPSASVMSLAAGSDGGLWVGTRQGVCKVRRNGRDNLAVERPDGLKDGFIQSLLLSRGTLWTGALSGLSVLAPGQPVRHYSRTHLGNPSVEALAEDREGNLWIGTEGGGALKLAARGAVTYTEADGLAPGQIAGLFEGPAGKLSVFSRTRDGAFISEFHDNRLVFVKAPLTAQMLASGRAIGQALLIDRHAAWWVATADGLARFGPARTLSELARARPQKVYGVADGLEGSNLKAVFEDTRGGVWASTVSSRRNGLGRFDPASGRFRSFSEADGLPPLQRAEVHAFCEDRGGNLWLALFRYGVARFRATRFELFPPEVTGLAGARTVYCDGAGRVWIGSSQQGLIRVDDPTAASPQFRKYTTAEGLSSDLVQCITEDRFGRIYAGTGQGLDRLDPASGRLKHFFTSDGLAPGLQVALQGRDGALWFGTQEGLSRLLPYPESAGAPPPVRITRVRTAGADRSIPDLGAVRLDDLVLGPYENQVEIDFAGWQFGTGELLSYQYRLDGLENEWSPPGQRRNVNYARLPSGTYRFLVRAIDAAGLITPEPAMVGFRILPPLWNRWWMRAIMALAAAAIIYTIYRYRVRRLVELERVRIRIATDLHDDIGSSLSQVAILSEVLRSRIDETNVQVADPVSRIAEISREVVDSMSDIVWAVNPRRDHLGDLVKRMRRLTGDVLTARNIEFKFTASDMPEEAPLGAEPRQHLYLLYKEALNNLARHSHCSQADIRLHCQGRWLEINIEDDGVGFEVSRESDGNGLMSMRRRAAALGGTLNITSRPGAGTAIAFRAPWK